MKYKISIVVMISLLSGTALPISNDEFASAVKTAANAIADGGELTLENIMTYTPIPLIPGVSGFFKKITFDRTVTITADFENQVATIEGTYTTTDQKSGYGIIRFSGNLQNFTTGTTILKPTSSIDEPSQKAAQKQLNDALNTLTALQYSVIIDYPSLQKVSAIDSRLKPLDVISEQQNSKLVFIYCTPQYYTDPQWGEALQGFNIGFKTRLLPDPFDKAQQFLNKFNVPLGINEDITFMGAISPVIFGSQFALTIPGELKFGLDAEHIIAKTELLRVGFLLYSWNDPLIFFIESGLDINLPKPFSTVKIPIRLTFDPISLNFGIVGSVENVTIHPYPFDIKRLFVSSSLNIETAIETAGIASINSLGLGGTVNILGRDVELIFCFFIADNNLNLVLKALLASESNTQSVLSLKDIVNLYTDIINLNFKLYHINHEISDSARASALSNVPDITLDSAYFYFSPLAGLCGGIMYPAGMGIEASGSLFGVDMSADFYYGLLYQIIPSGLYGNFKLGKINAGPLTITSTDGKTGPTMKFSLGFPLDYAPTAERPQASILPTFTYDGAIALDLPGLKTLSASTSGSIGLNQITGTGSIEIPPFGSGQFTSTLPLTNLVVSAFKGAPKGPQFSVVLDNESTQQLSAQINSRLTEVVSQAQKIISDALQPLQDSLNSAKDKLGSLENPVIPTSITPAQIKNQLQSCLSNNPPTQATVAIQSMVNRNMTTISPALLQNKLNSLTQVTPQQRAEIESILKQGAS